MKLEHHHDSPQQRLLADFYAALSPPGYQEEPLNLPKLALYELSQRDSPDHKHTHNIYGVLRHFDREVI